MCRTTENLYDVLFVWLFSLLNSRRTHLSSGGIHRECSTEETPESRWVTIPTLSFTALHGVAMTIRFSREAVYHSSSWWTTNVSRCRERYVTFSGFGSETVTKFVRRVLVFGSLDELGRSFFCNRARLDFWLCSISWLVMSVLIFRDYKKKSLQMLFLYCRFAFPVINDNAGD